MKTYHKKIMILSVCILIICICVVYLFYLPKNDETDLGSPEIIVLETAGNVSINPNSYVPKYSFIIGQKIWVYMEYTNISHGSSCDFSIILSITHQDGEQMALVENRITQDEKACFYYFNTTESWPEGLYIVSSKLTDNISGKDSGVKLTAFDLNSF